MRDMMRNTTSPLRVVRRECPADPLWEPLLTVVSDEEILGAMMFMGTAVLEDKNVLYLYKHRITRRYLNVDEAGNCFEFNPDDKAYFRIVHQKPSL
jgi:hypothetical protein